ncbi:MAG TPA: 4Fe-4S dicluster domain-containing protein [Candidatus Acidoferrum sp.]|nr:4Fe-4S dicluster domain-containing protein [Candidatus Acidoferrum sp.]
MTTPAQNQREVHRRITYESDLDPHFGEKIAKLARGEKLFSCIQCGTCSATCPVSHYMDYTPRRVIAMVREGFRYEVLNSQTIWLCASCYSCTVECPREIKITDVMYALKQEAISQGVYPKRFPIPVLAREFFRGVEQHGRSSEGLLMVKFYLKTNPLEMLKNVTVAWRLWRTGRLSLGKEGTRDKGTVRTLLRAAKQAEGGGAQ